MYFLHVCILIGSATPLGRFLLKKSVITRTFIVSVFVTFCLVKFLGVLISRMIKRRVTTWQHYGCLLEREICSTNFCTGGACFVIMFNKP
jgi:hypothetical protein